ncbi:hypothetical protein ACQ7DA_09560 [Zafaria sp. J156]|uniref:hypothetical protein n=1 Tax=Zafaria sp. J156 TaxID=3116490 RepID=UPI002E7908B2|nr:hypothetical protein [Zafaria sp. J156]MEE1621927.1 hypothetical protein [Zafaria sp. J156]
MATSSETHQARDTLRYLRLMLLVVPLLLLVAIAVYAWWTGTIEESISSYYLGPARDLFVAMLVATGVLLVVYKGSSPLEDYALNFAGFYAMFVAFVPTRLGETLGGLEPDERLELIRSIQVAVVAVLVVAAVFAWLDFRTTGWAPARLLRDPWTRILTIASFVFLAGFVVLLLWRTVEGNEFAGVHLAATLLLIASMGVAIASHLGPGPLSAVDTSGGRRRSYAVLLTIMVLGIPAVLILTALGLKQAVFVVEWIEIGVFTTFWFLETRRTWHEGVA